MRMLAVELGLGAPASWPATLGWALAWLVLMLAYSPVTDRLASRWFAKPPNLRAFRAVQQSRTKLVLGILIAWLLGGLVEEVVLRGMILQAARDLTTNSLGTLPAAAVGILLAAAVAWLIHLYQGLRAAFIIAQLSILFGAQFVAIGGNLWSVILCHGFYDTVALVRFAYRKSKYSIIDAGNSGPE